MDVRLRSPKLGGTCFVQSPQTLQSADAEASTCRQQEKTREASTQPPGHGRRPHAKSRETAAHEDNPLQQTRRVLRTVPPIVPGAEVNHRLWLEPPEDVAERKAYVTKVIDRLNILEKEAAVAVELNKSMDSIQRGGSHLQAHNARKEGRCGATQGHKQSSSASREAPNFQGQILSCRATLFELRTIQSQEFEEAVASDESVDEENVEAEAGASSSQQPGYSLLSLHAASPLPPDNLTATGACRSAWCTAGGNECTSSIPQVEISSRRQPILLRQQVPSFCSVRCRVRRRVNEMACHRVAADNPLSP